MADLEHLRSLIRQAVSDTIDPDNTGVVVSGGLDSSTVAAHADGLPMFTGYYDHPVYDERRFARLATTGASEHHEILIGPQDFIDNFDQMVPHLQKPFQGMGTFGQYMVGKYIRDNTNVKVVLSGEGSDELFGGYARLLKVAGEPLPDGYENYQPPADYPTTVRGALAYDFVRLGDLLAVDDQCMAAHGLEARAPFTDVSIIEYALALEPAERVGKKTLKNAMRGIVDDRIIDRTDKMGFPIPLVEWANGACRDFVGDRIGYIPDADAPWDRGWWYDLLNSATRASIAA